MQVGYIYSFADLLLFGLAAVFAKKGIKKNNAKSSAALWGSLYAAFTFLWAKNQVLGGGITEIAPKSLLFLLGIGALTGASILFLFQALQTGESIRIIPVYLLNGTITLFARAFLTHEELSRNTILVRSILILGTLLIALHENKGRRRGGYQWLGFSLLSAACESAATLLLGYGAGDVDGGLALFLRSVLGAILIWLVTVAVGEAKALNSMRFLDGFLICLSAIAIGLEHYIYPKGTLSMLHPFWFVAVLLLGALILKERFGSKLIIGYVIFAIGTYLLVSGINLI